METCIDASDQISPNKLNYQLQSTFCKNLYIYIQTCLVKRSMSLALIGFIVIFSNFLFNFLHS